jgi:hypothetical protein
MPRRDLGASDKINVKDDEAILKEVKNTEGKRSKGFR